MKQRSVVVGVLLGADDEVVMIPEKHAVTLARLHDALSSAKTWAEFKRLAPKRYYQEALERASEGEDEAVTPKSPFDPMQIYGLGDGDWPDWPSQQMLGWVPAEVRAKFGRSESSVLNGPFLCLAAADLDEIMSAMEAHGYKCRRDDDLVSRAHGN
jgi:hypothetical protein